MIDIKVLINESSKLSVRKQCDLLALPRSSCYYMPKGELQENLEIMATMDKHIANNGLDLYTGIKKWINRYHNRDHQGIERRKPKNIFKNAA